MSNKHEIVSGEISRFIIFAQHFTDEMEQYIFSKDRFVMLHFSKGEKNTSISSISRVIETDLDEVHKAGQKVAIAKTERNLMKGKERSYYCGFSNCLIENVILKEDHFDISAFLDHEDGLKSHVSIDINITVVGKSAIANAKTRVMSILKDAFDCSPIIATKTLEEDSSADHPLIKYPNLFPVRSIEI